VTVGRVAVAFHARADAVRDIGPRGMVTLAKAAKDIGRQEAARATGGDGVLTGTKRRGIRLRLFDDITTGHTVTFLTIKARPAGPWVWVTSGTGPHKIRRRKRGPLRKMTVDHPGTRGAAAFTRTRERIARVLPGIFRDELHSAVTR